MAEGRRSTDARRALSTALIVVGAALLLVGGVLFYAREELFDADAFSRTAAESLRDDPVRDALAEPIVEQIVNVGPDALINAQPLLEGAVSGALDTAAFRDVFQDAVRKAHRALFKKDRDELVLTISDANAVIVDSVRVLDPKVAKQIPDDVGRRLVEVTDSKPALTAARIGEEVRVLGLLLPPLAVLVLAAGVIVAPDRRGGLVNAFSALATAAAVGFVALIAAQTLLLRRFAGDETVHDAIAALYGDYFGGLLTAFLLSGVIAVALAAAAAAREPKPLERPRRLLAWIASGPEGRPARAGRAVAIGIAAVIAFLEPTFALQVVAVFAGAVGIYYAVVELIAAIAPPPAPAGRGPRASRRESRTPARWWIPALGGAAVLAIAITAALLLTGEEERDAGRPPGPVEACNGYPELCDRPVEDVVLPATHNAMSAAELPGWFTPNQRRGIPRQLDDGVRALLIDTHYGIRRASGPVLTDLEREGASKVLEGVREQLGPEGAARFQSLQARFAKGGGGGKPGAYLCHVVCELGSIQLVKALGWVREFLETHPDEFVVLFVEDKVSPADTAKAFERSGILRFAHVHRPGTPFPTLRELIEADERLFVMAEEDSGDGAYPWYHQGFELTQETPYTFNSARELTGPASCVPNRGTANDPLFQLNHWVEKLPRSPETAEKVNAFGFLERRARRCSSRRGLVPNIVAVDYYERGDLFAAARVLNGLPRDARPSYRERD